MIETPKDIASVEALLAEIPEHPSKMNLSALLNWVRDNDSDYKGLSDEELFLRGCGNLDQAKILHKGARLTGKCDVMIPFCIARIEKMAREMLTKPGPKNPKPAT